MKINLYFNVGQLHNPFTIVKNTPPARHQTQATAVPARSEAPERAMIPPITGNKTHYG
jgi:hypothetical protein